MNLMRLFLNFENDEDEYDVRGRVCKNLLSLRIRVSDDGQGQLDRLDYALPHFIARRIGVSRPFLDFDQSSVTTDMDSWP